MEYMVIAGILRGIPRVILEGVVIGILTEIRLISISQEQQKSKLEILN